MLHETEFIAPHTGTSPPVYLSGNLCVKTDLPAPLNNWPDTSKNLRVSAERGYGWGRLQLVACGIHGNPFTTHPR